MPRGEVADPVFSCDASDETQGRSRVLEKGGQEKGGAGGVCPVLLLAGRALRSGEHGRKENVQRVRGRLCFRESGGGLRTQAAQVPVPDHLGL